MSKFIKLSNLLLNTNSIHSINMVQNKYFIRLSNNNIKGHWYCLFGFGYGKMEEYTHDIEVCKLKNPMDYEIITEWVNKINNIYTLEDFK